HVPPPRPQNSPIRPAPPVSAASPYPHCRAPPNPPRIPPIRSAPRRNRPPRAAPIPAAGGRPRGQASRRPVTRPPRCRRLYQGNLFAPYGPDSYRSMGSFTELAGNFIGILASSFEISVFHARFSRGPRKGAVFAADLLACLTDLMNLDAVSCGN
uniref:Uncharacterized protein n=1 Tax=Aegilops tauschii subsp. strangulata TaxID=200361 RepID=A0A453QC59_AEGTS